MAFVKSARFHIKLDGLLSLFFVTAIVLSTPLLRLKAQIRIDQWTTDNGLPQNSVTGVVTAPDGYIWFTTNEGLVRFDGVRFKVFNRSNTPEITNNRMAGAFADKSGKIWLNTEEGAILSYDKGLFRIAMKPDDVPPGVHSRFFADPSGSVIFYLSYRDYREMKSSFKHFHYQEGKFVPLKIEGLTEDSFLVLTDREGGLWFTDGKVLRRFKDGKISDLDLSWFGTGQIDNVAYQDRQGSIWLGYTQGPKQFLLRIKEGGVESLPLPAALVSHFAEDSRGNLWISLFNQGVYRIDQKSVIADGQLTNVLEPVLTLERIPFISQGYLFPDREGGMWVGTNEGLLRLMPQTIRVFSKLDGLPEENVYPIYEDKAGRIWAGIWENSLVQFEHGGFKTFLKTQDTYYPTSLVEDRNGRFWIGTSNRLYHLDKDKLVRLTEQAVYTGDTEMTVISQYRDNN